jgi:hypothetical protein
MSILRSYINKNNTLISNSNVNTGRNPVVELNFGSSDLLTYNNGFTRFIFDLDLSLLQENISQGIIPTGCESLMTHRLKMTNTSSFDNDLLNTSMSNSKKRATSFDLILFRIPNYSEEIVNSQYWDEGVGYDYNDFNVNRPSSVGGMSPLTHVDSRSFSNRPSNWFQTTTIDKWSEPGIYNNNNTGLVNFSGLTVISRQHFELGNENLDMDMTNEINGILDGSITGVTGWGIAYLPQIENITGLTDSYSVAFFSRHTQTFYQPYLQTNYNDLVLDNRNSFLKNQINKLYLYVYQNGDYQNLDEPPRVKILDREGNVYQGLSDLNTCQKSKGIYEVTIPNVFSNSSSPCTYYDVWENLSINDEQIPSVENQFTLKPLSYGIQIGDKSNSKTKFGFSFYGINQNEKIINSDIRKIGVTIKEAYTGNHLINNIDAKYRIYVKEGNTEVSVQEWTTINRTSTEYYFMIDMRDKIPNQYYVDIQVNISGEKDTYKDQLTFNIVNQKK